MNGEQAAPREPLHLRVAGWLERAFNPIMVKELRASLRGSRFFIAHLAILSCFTGALLIAFAVGMSQDTFHTYDDTFGARTYTGDPSRVGQWVYVVTQLVHLGVVFLVVPGLAAASVTTEREALTHELLISTTLTARQIVWGKFTAAMAQTFTIFVSMLPMVGLCFLFGGVTVYQIVANYVFLFALSALMVIFALSISASARTTQRAVGSVYAMALLAGSFVGFLVWAAVEERASLPLSMGVAFGFLPSGTEEAARHPLSLFDRVFYVHVLPGFLWTALLALFFINAVNRLKPIYANRSTALRLYYLATTLAGGALFVLVLYAELPPASSSPMDRSLATTAFAMILSSAFLMGALFACEDPVLPPALAERVAALRGWRKGFRILWPGSGSGAMFALLCATLILGLSFAALAPFAGGFNAGPWAGLPAAFPLALALVLLLLWSYFTTMLARFLASVLPGRPVLTRAILAITGLFLAIFPIVHWAIAQAIDRRPDDPLLQHGPATLALSPAAAVLSTLDLAPRQRHFPLYCGGVPIPAAFALFTLLAGTAFLFLAEKATARLRARLAREPGP